MRDHGGNLDAAMAHFGGSEWIDLSTGINRRPYPLPAFSPDDWNALPTASALEALIEAAAQAYRVTPAQVLSVSGAQAAIQLYPRLVSPGVARIIAPTYNEHAASLHAQGWQVQEVRTLDALAGADLAIVVNPNNPDGAVYAPDELVALSQNVGLLIVDESFADPTPDISVAPFLSESLVVLRSFGKFFGLAGARLGFVLASPDLITRLRDLSGPWAVNGPAIAVGTQALRDTDWHRSTTARLSDDTARLDQLAAQRGWRLVGGTALFRTYETNDAKSAQTHLAQHQIWSRIFPYSDTWIRLGLPDGAQEWARVETAFTA